MRKVRSVSADRAGGGNTRQVELASAVETDAVSALLDGEDPAHVVMPASEDELRDPKKGIHQP